MTSITTASWRRRALTTALAMFALASPACETDPDHLADGIYVGRVGDIMVAIVAEDDLVTAYACDGVDGVVSISEWFHGQLERGNGDLTGDHGAELVLEFGEDHFFAELQRGDGDPLKLRGVLVDDDDRGLFWGEAGDWDGGWIFDENGDQRGAVIKRNTGDLAAFALPSAGPQSITLEDSTVMAVTQMVAPKHVH